LWLQDAEIVKFYFEPKLFPNSSNAFLFEADLTDADLSDAFLKGSVMPDGTDYA
jgi:uncharacterized protein YjbI with pentapeptide repeats